MCWCLGGAEIQPGSAESHSHDVWLQHRGEEGAFLVNILIKERVP